MTNLKIGDNEDVEERALGEADWRPPPSNKSALSSSLTAPFPISTKFTSECLLTEIQNFSAINYVNCNRITNKNVEFGAYALDTSEFFLYSKYSA